MVRIGVTPAAFEAIITTMLFGSVSFQCGPTVERMIWLDADIGDQLSAMREPGETYSDLILRLVEIA